MTQRGQAGAGRAISATAIPEVISCHAVTAQGCKERSHPAESWPGWAPWGSGPARRERVQNPREGGSWSHRLRAESRDGSRPGDGVGSSDPARTWPAHGQCAAQSRWAVENGEHTGSSSPLKARHRRKLGPVVPCASGRGGPAPAKDLGNGILSEGEFPQEASASRHSDMAGNNPSKGSVSAASKRYCLGKGSLFPRIIHPAGKNQPDFCLLKNTGHQERGHRGSTRPPTLRGCSHASRCCLRAPLGRAQVATVTARSWPALAINTLPRVSPVQWPLHQGRDRMAAWPPRWDRDPMELLQAEPGSLPAGAGCGHGAAWHGQGRAR